MLGVCFLAKHDLASLAKIFKLWKTMQIEDCVTMLQAFEWMTEITQKQFHANKHAVRLNRISTKQS